MNKGSRKKEALKKDFGKNKDCIYENGKCGVRCISIKTMMC